MNAQTRTEENQMNTRRRNGKHNTCAVCHEHIDKSDCGRQWHTLISTRVIYRLPEGEVRVPKSGQFKGEELDWEEQKGELLTFCNMCYCIHLLDAVTNARIAALKIKKED